MLYLPTEFPVLNTRTKHISHVTLTFLSKGDAPFPLLKHFPALAEINCITPTRKWNFGDLPLPSIGGGWINPALWCCLWGCPGIKDGEETVSTRPRLHALAVDNKTSPLFPRPESALTGDAEVSEIARKTTRSSRCEILGTESRLRASNGCPGTWPAS